ncbi:hypothetical protein WH06_16525 [Aeromonas salmonicida subsp. salmonicida]|uniref:Uncharacterized protein n=1 Tax=Aeromonas salmonicida subsp. salmonicida 01-B526 TaxID=1076135 RepID=A0ABN0DWZ6_AERSS|nr:hypothetical protein C5P03_00885 [Aeromonas salmonicida subsp. salmonicida 01-B526]KHE98097.1 hypothetical protein NV17_10365 [Aeromonas salmonicida subsp. salmonicida]ORJ11013.1 hypothetical protein A7D02_03045 [Aeromonas salmonicida]EHI51263.1 hypothetical protein IYQ_16964 [Aeromonas salmonicida subsp. salmonicida 01-B526]KHE98135.1 hypothetical protein NX85_16275 [Aeromonas salmonicida subsp. salmonicida]
MGHRAVALLMAAQHDGKKRQEEREKKSCLGIDMPRSQPAIFLVPRISKIQMRKGRSLSGLF